MGHAKPRPTTMRAVSTAETTAESTTDLFGMPKDELVDWMVKRGQPKYRGVQIAHWMYHKRAADFQAMTDLPLGLRAQLTSAAVVGRPQVAARIPSAQDDSVKYLFELPDGERIESVLMPEKKRVTLCVSSQVGCAQGCTFCATAAVGLRRNLTAGEMVGQILQAEEDSGRHGVSNVVFMGMGEPLANYSNLCRALQVVTHEDGLGISSRRVTVSTSGLVPAIERFTRDGIRAELALSLNATTDRVRTALIPSNRRYTLAKVLDACRQWARASGRPLTVEYVLLRGVNDSLEDARRLCRLLRGIRSKVNLIPFNAIAGSSFSRPDERQVAAFRDVLARAHTTVTLRSTRGQDIDAACGQLCANYGERAAEASRLCS